MTTRRRAREIVLQLLYEEDLNPDQDEQVAQHFLSARMHGNRPLVEFAKRLWTEVRGRRREIDKTLSDRATNWSLRRMAAIDRNVLRMGCYEILMSDTPGRVAINEAVELAKRYGDKNSGQFVNGILDRILHEANSTANETTSSSDSTSGSNHSANSPTDEGGAAKSIVGESGT